MITVEERAYLQWLAREEWSGSRSIVELGPWLGGSTWCLASGMLANPRREIGPSLHVVDNFKWRPFMSERADLPLAAGESFRPAFEHNLQSMRDIIVVHEARLPDDASADLEFQDPVRDPAEDVPLLHGSAIGDDVEILFVDGAKSWRALVHLLCELAPRLAPGGLLVFQDHRGWGSYWVPMCVALLRERFPGRLVPVHVTTFNTTTYRLTGLLDPEVLAELPRTIDDVTLAEGLRLMQAAAREMRQFGDASGARVIELAACTFCGAKGDWLKAARIFGWLDARWPVEGSLVDLERTRAWLHIRTGTFPAPSPHARRVISLRHWRERLLRLAGRSRDSAAQALRPRGRFRPTRRGESAP